MFVLKSTYENLKREKNRLYEKVAMYEIQMYMKNIEIKELSHKYTSLLSRKESDKDSSNIKQFNSNEIKKLINLCHPDKHNGKQMAHDMTDKLLKLR